MKKKLILFLTTLNQQKLVAIIMVLMFIGFALVNPAFISAASINNLLRTLSLFGIASVGMTLVIITGCTDLSAGSNMALSGAVGAGLLGIGFNAANPVQFPFAVTIVLALLASALVGAMNGVFVTKLKIAPFVATLASMAIVRGLVHVVIDTTVQGVSGTPITFMHSGYTALGLGSVGQIPIQTIIFFLVVLLMHLLMRYTTLGRNIYTVGGNREIARLAGIKTDRTIIIAYSISGALIGLSGLILVGMLSSASPLAARGFELDFITAVALGGASIAGGRGTILGTLIGVSFISIMNNGLDMIMVPSFYQFLIKGVILVLAVYSDHLFRARKAKVVKRSGA